MNLKAVMPSCTIGVVLMKVRGPGTATPWHSGSESINQTQEPLMIANINCILIATACVSLLVGPRDSSGQSTSSPTDSGMVVRLEDYREGVKYNRSLTWSGFSQDGSKVVTASSDATVRLYESQTGRQIATISDGERTYAFAAAIDPRGRWVVTGGPWMRMRSAGRPGWKGGIVRIWDLHDQWDTNRYSEIFRYASPKIITSISVSVDGRYISGLDVRSNYFLIDSLKSGNAVVRPTLSLGAEDILNDDNNSLPYQDASYSDDGHRTVARATKGGESGILLYDGHRKRVRFVSASQLRDAIHTGSSHPGGDNRGGKTALISPDGDSIAIHLNSHENFLFIFDFDAVTVKHTIRLSHQGGAVVRMAFALNGREIAVATVDGNINLYNVQNSELISAFEVSGWMKPVRAMAFTEDRLLVLGGAGTRAEQLVPGAFSEQEDQSRIYISKYNLVK